MSNKIFVVPADGLIVRYPEQPSRILPENGAEVPETSYWLRRIADGDVLVVNLNNEPDVGHGE